VAAQQEAANQQRMAERQRTRQGCRWPTRAHDIEPLTLEEVWGLGFRVEGLGFRVEGLGFGVWGFWVCGVAGRLVYTRHKP
jgi:hypothetical protein